MQVPEKIQKLSKVVYKFISTAIGIAVSFKFWKTHIRGKFIEGAIAYVVLSHFLLAHLLLGVTTGEETADIFSWGKMSVARNLQVQP